MTSLLGRKTSCHGDVVASQTDDLCSRSLRALERTMDQRREAIQYGVFLSTGETGGEGSMHHFCHSVMDSLVDYDKTRGRELEKTLGAYFEFNGNVRAISEALYTHYNTIPCRLQRIQELTGMNLEDEDDRYCLQTALKVKLFLNNEY